MVGGAKGHKETRPASTAKDKILIFKFLDLWKDADPGIAEVEDARIFIIDKQ
jgi:hypothetical protein